MERLLYFLVATLVVVGAIASPSFSEDEARSTEGFRYHTSKTDPYLITSLPEIDLDVGELYGGLVPINKSDPSRELYFIFKPAQGAPSTDLTIWLGGGPGCSSIDGFLQENGPVLWQAGMWKALPNPYSWAKHTNMLWVDQPVGAGFSVGEVTARNEKDVARDFLGFLQNWEHVFGVKNYRIFMTGVSNAGRYVPYISAAMLDRHDKECFDLQGNLMYSPAIGDDQFIGRMVPLYNFVQQNNAILNFDNHVMKKLEHQYVSCGYAEYTEKYLRFPPPGIQPIPESPLDAVSSLTCNSFDTYVRAEYRINPCWNPVHITDYCPYLVDPLGSQPGWGPPITYYNRVDVKKAIHAPENVTWLLCQPPGVSVFKGPPLSPFGTPNGTGPQGTNDRSPNSIIHVLPQVIEATQRVLISHGNWDGNLIANGTLLSIQNMTWGGQLGFQQPPTKDFRVPIGFQGVIGTQHYERGLMWTLVHQAGHDGPQDQPRAALQQLKWVLGLIEDL